LEIAVAEINPPAWLQNAGATHTAAQMRSFIGVLSGQSTANGTLIPAGGIAYGYGNQLITTQAGSPNMTVLVKSGAAWIPGTENATQGAYGVENDADVTLSIGANGSGLTRIDSVFYKVQDSQYSGGVNTSSLVVVAGTPSGSPVPPAAPANSIRVSNITVANGAASITNANIDVTIRVFMDTTGDMRSVDIFTSSGTWTKPQFAKYAIIEVQGGGGGSGGTAATSAGQSAASSGGGGGGYARKVLASNALTQTVAVTVGAGGSGGSAGNNNGNAGGTSSFGAFCVALGGGGGFGAPSSASNNINSGGNGGGGTVGDFLLTGSDANCSTIGSAGMVFSPSNGGTSFFGGSQRAASGTSVAGTVGRTYGGGASGGYNQPSQSATAGATGGAGIVIVYSFY